MSLIFSFRNISPPAGHEFDILDIALLPFQLEVTVDSNIENIQESVITIRTIANSQITEIQLTIMGQPVPSHQEGFSRGVGMPGIRPSAHHLLWCQYQLDRDPYHLVSEPLSSATFGIHDGSPDNDTIEVRISQNYKKSTRTYNRIGKIGVIRSS